MSNPETPDAAPPSARRSAFGLGFWFGALWVGLVAFSALAASWLPLHPNRFDPPNAFRAPSWSHPFGTTRLGEDVFAICVHGARVAIIVGLGSALIALAVGAALGLAAGYFRGTTDRIITLVLDAFMAIPGLVFALALVLFLGQSITTVVIVIGLLTAPSFARVTRSATLAIADRDFITAARLTGARHRRILLREIGPNIAAPLGSYLLLLAGFAILLEGGLSFLGLGVPLDKASWGRLVAGGRDELQRAWWWSLCPSGVFFLTILSLNLVHEALLDRWAGRPHAPRRRPGAGALARRATRRSAGPKNVTTASAGPQSVTTASVGALQLFDVHVSLPTPFGLLRAVDGVSLRIERGEMLAIVGESGAGKTMLARAILGIEPAGAVVSGEIRLDSADLRTLSASELRARRGREIAIVLQDPMTSLDPVMRIGHQIAEFARLHRGLSRSHARREAVQLLSDVGVAEPARRARQYPHELSGGVRQRVAIALALAGNPKVLIADEPTSALDVIVQAQILDLIDRLRRERDLAVVLITHDLTLAATRADRVAVMYAGRIVEQASVLRASSGWRSPYASALFASAPRLASPSHERLAPIGGRAPVRIGDDTGCGFAPRCRLATEHCHRDAPVLAPIDHDRLVACWTPIDLAPLSSPFTGVTANTEVPADSPGLSREPGLTVTQPQRSFKP